MNTAFRKLYKDALALLRRLSTSNGILASAVAADNYKRIWARDGIICGIAGLLANDEIITEGLKNILLTLAGHQHELGMIPSNISVDNHDISYGSLTARIDTNTWFMVGACLYFINTGDDKTWQMLRPAAEKCRVYLKTAELNARGWIYTPLSGNWADEYPVHGYTLYDNMLRIWGESLWCKILFKSDEKLQHIKLKTLANFWPRENVPKYQMYQEAVFNEALKASVPHFLAFILPGSYDMRFDAAGNALALLHFKLGPDQKKAMLDFLSILKQEISKVLLPAFWPAIREGDPDWSLLKNNYAFAFKNKPYHFHNGGIWPVWTGLFCLGLANNGLTETVKEIVHDFTEVVSGSNNWDLHEYFSSDTLRAAGKTQMGFTASGIVFMHKAIENENFKQILGL